LPRKRLSFNLTLTSSIVVQVAWEVVVQGGMSPTSGASATQCSVHVGIQQMEYTRLVGTHFRSVSPFSGKLAHSN
jgi:hypothetical protein